MRTFATHGTLLALGEEPLDTVHGSFRLHWFQDLARRQPALAVTRGDLASPKPILARVHSSCITSEALGALDCDCAAQLDQALAAIARAGRGVVFYLLQEGRGAGLAAKARDRMLVQASGQRLTTFEAYKRMGLGADQRRYDEVAAMCQLLGVRAPLRVMTNNPEKVAVLEREGLTIAGTKALGHEVTSFNAHYLAAKSRSGHSLPRASRPSREKARPPRPLVNVEPHALADDPSWLLLSRYWLPVAREGSGELWLQAHLHYGLDRGEERLVLRRGSPRARRAVVAVQEDDVRDRFPLEPAGPHRRTWKALVEAVAEEESGCILLRTVVAKRRSTKPVSERDVRLIAHHLGGRPARVLGASPASAAALARRLEQHGIEVEVGKAG